MKAWFGRALLSLSVAVSCAKATDDDLLGGDDDSGGTSSGGVAGTGFGGTSGTGANPFGGAAGLGGTSGGKGGTATGGANATGGKGGTAGADAGGASDGGEGGVDPCTPVGTPPELRVDYKASTQPITGDPEGEFHLVNDTNQGIVLSELTFRYWMRSEFTCDETTDRMTVNVVHQQFDRPYAVMTPASVTNRIVDLEAGAPGCDIYFELGFTAQAGSLAAGQIAVVKYYAPIPIYETARPKNQSNDYSYGACTTLFVYWDRITVYRDGRLVSGTPPGGGGGEGGAGGEGGGSGGI